MALLFLKQNENERVNGAPILSVFLFEVQLYIPLAPLEIVAGLLSDKPNMRCKVEKIISLIISGTKLQSCAPTLLAIKRYYKILFKNTKSIKVKTVAFRKK